MSCCFDDGYRKTLTAAVKEQSRSGSRNAVNDIISYSMQTHFHPTRVAAREATTAVRQRGKSTCASEKGRKRQRLGRTRQRSHHGSSKARRSSSRSNSPCPLEEGLQNEITVLVRSKSVLAQDEDGGSGSDGSAPNDSYSDSDADFPKVKPAQHKEAGGQCAGDDIDLADTPLPQHPPPFLRLGSTIDDVTTALLQCQVLFPKDCLATGVDLSEQSLSIPVETAWAEKDGASDGGSGGSTGDDDERAEKGSASKLFPHECVDPPPRLIMSLTLDQVVDDLLVAVWPMLVDHLGAKETVLPIHAPASPLLPATPGLASISARTPALASAYTGPPATFDTTHVTASSENDGVSSAVMGVDTGRAQNDNGRTIGLGADALTSSFTNNDADSDQAPVPALAGDTYTGSELTEPMHTPAAAHNPHSSLGAASDVAPNPASTSVSIPVPMYGLVYEQQDDNVGSALDDALDVSASPSDSASASSSSFSSSSSLAAPASSPPTVAARTDVDLDHAAAIIPTADMTDGATLDGSIVMPVDEISVPVLPSVPAAVLAQEFAQAPAIENIIDDMDSGRCSAVATRIPGPAALSTPANASYMEDAYSSPGAMMTSEGSTSTADSSSHRVIGTDVSEQQSCTFRAVMSAGSYYSLVDDIWCTLHRCPGFTAGLIPSLIDILSDCTISRTLVGSDPSPYDSVTIVCTSVTMARLICFARRVRALSLSVLRLAVVDCPLLADPAYIVDVAISTAGMNNMFESSSANSPRQSPPVLNYVAPIDTAASPFPPSKRLKISAEEPPRSAIASAMLVTPILELQYQPYSRASLGICDSSSAAFFSITPNFTAETLSCTPCQRHQVLCSTPKGECSVVPLLSGYSDTVVAKRRAKESTTLMPLAHKDTSSVLAFSIPMDCPSPLKSLTSARTFPSGEVCDDSSSSKPARPINSPECASKVEPSSLPQLLAPPSSPPILELAPATTPKSILKKRSRGTNFAFYGSGARSFLARTPVAASISFDWVPSFDSPSRPEGIPAAVAVVAGVANGGGSADIDPDEMSSMPKKRVRFSRANQVKTIEEVDRAAFEASERSGGFLGTTASRSRGRHSLRPSLHVAHPDPSRSVSLGGSSDTRDPNSRASSGGSDNSSPSYFGLFHECNSVTPMMVAGPRCGNVHESAAAGVDSVGAAACEPGGASNCSSPLVFPTSIVVSTVPSHILIPCAHPPTALSGLLPSPSSIVSSLSESTATDLGSDLFYSDYPMEEDQDEIDPALPAAVTTLSSSRGGSRGGTAVLPVLGGDIGGTESRNRDHGLTVGLSVADGAATSVSGAGVATEVGMDQTVQAKSSCDGCDDNNEGDEDDQSMEVNGTDDAELAPFSFASNFEEFVADSHEHLGASSSGGDADESSSGSGRSVDDGADPMDDLFTEASPFCQQLAVSPAENMRLSMARAPQQAAPLLAALSDSIVGMNRHGQASIGADT